jgi:hypothetical protein
MYSARTPKINVSMPNTNRARVMIEPNPGNGTPLVSQTESIIKNVTTATSEDKNPKMLIALIGK